MDNTPLKGPPPGATLPLQGRDEAIIQSYRERCRRQRLKAINALLIPPAIIGSAWLVSPPWARRYPLFFLAAATMAVLLRLQTALERIRPFCPSCELGHGARSRTGGLRCSHCHTPLS